MKRLCFISPNLSMTHTIVSELGQVGITESHVHVVGKHPDWVAEAHLHNASILQTTNLIPALIKGVIFGIALVVGIFALFYYYLPEGTQMAPLAILAIIGFGFMFALWASAMIGFGVKNEIVEQTEGAVKTGHYLVMIDVPKDRMQEVSDRIIENHPEVHFAQEFTHH